jgi:hypothetical protein
MTEKREAGGLGLEVLAGGLAAVTAAMIGSGLGVTGTVLGAGIASVVSTVAAALYLRSARSVAVRTGIRTGVERPRRPRRAAGWPVLVTGGVLAFVLGMLVITGVEWVRGAPLSGGQGTTVGAIVAPRPHRAPPPVEEPVPVTGAPESTATTTTTAAPTTTTITPPPATTPTTTWSPSATTTTTTGHSEPDRSPETGPTR